MSLVLYGHPLSSYVQKVLIALYENGTPFEWRLLERANPASGEEWLRLWPFGKMPLLVDAGRAIPESSIIIEHLALHHGGSVVLVPRDPVAALPVRAMDRFFDLYVSTPMQQLVGEVLRAAAGSDSRSDEWRGRLDTAYAWLDRELAGREWATGGEFTMADCSAGPALLYAGWVHPIPARLGTLAAYRRRLLARPSYARAVDEARPHRHLFPLPIPPGD